jgi:hypothetical protein
MLGQVYLSAHSDLKIMPVLTELKSKNNKFKSFCTLFDLIGVSGPFLPF